MYIKRMLSSRLPWQLDLFSSQTKTFVSEITGRIRAWKQADSCSEDLPLAIQIGQCLLLLGFNGKFAFFTVGRCTKTKTVILSDNSNESELRARSDEATTTRCRKQKLRKDQLLRLRQPCTCSAVVVDRSPSSGIVSHFTVSRASCLCVHGFELRRQAKARAQGAHACRRSARRGQTVVRRGYSCRWGIMAY